MRKYPAYLQLVQHEGFLALRSSAGLPDGAARTNFCDTNFVERP
jgi:hypothetical protein